MASLSVGNREQLASAAAKMEAAVSAVASHRVHALRITGNSTKQLAEIAYQLAPRGTVQPQSLHMIGEYSETQQIDCIKRGALSAVQTPDKTV